MLTVKDIFIINSTVYSIAIMCVQHWERYQIFMHDFLEIYIQKLQDTSMYNLILKMKYFKGHAYSENLNNTNEPCVIKNYSFCNHWFDTVANC